MYFKGYCGLLVLGSQAVWAWPHLVTVRTNPREFHSRGDPTDDLRDADAVFLSTRLDIHELWTSPPPFTLPRVVKNLNPNSPPWPGTGNAFLSIPLDLKQMGLKQACVVSVCYDFLFSVDRQSNLEGRKPASASTFGTSKLLVNLMSRVVLLLPSTSIHIEHNNN